MNVVDLAFFLRSSANATPAFEGRGGEQLAAEISRFLYLAHSPVYNLSKLCIVPGQSCWKLFVDVLILECGGKVNNIANSDLNVKTHYI